MKILLLANYENDRQESMSRFAALLESELKKTGAAVQVIRPRPFFGLLKRRGTGIGKWLGYADKFLIFPFQLKRRIRKMGGDCVVHICDHSNAFYTRWLQGTPHLVTCNDVLAIRSAHGEFPQNRTGFTGRWLQRWILEGLRRARRITCISEATRKDLLRLLGDNRTDVDVTWMGLGRSWSPMPADEVARRLQTMPGVKQPFILHVGGDQWYKNRPGVLSIHAALGGIPQRVKLVMVGPRCGHGPDAMCLTRVDDETLRTLYCAAELLLFPSIAEGFGWPIVEAHACGCRVIAAGTLQEAGGDATFYLPVPTGDSKDRGWNEKAAQLVNEVLGQNKAGRHDVIVRGLKNAGRFSAEIMAQRYVAIYKELLYKA